MQALIRFDVSDHDAFRSAFDEAAERRAQAGLTQLQLWREEGASTVWGLFEVSDRSKAEDWLASETALRAQINGTQAHYLRTA